MKTLIFCTSYFDTEELYQKRYQKWIDYYNHHPFTNDKHMYLIDDCSDLELIIDTEIHTIKDCNEKYAHSRYYIVLEK